MGGETLGKYELRAVRGRGAMGTVYEAWDPLISRRVAIKTVRLSAPRDDGEEDTEAQDSLARFRREAQAAGRLNHPNIVGVYDYGETADLAYIVMEFVDGESVKAVLDRREVFSPAEVVRLMDQLLAGLQYSHERGVVHRDIKPGNVMLAENRQVKIADFGIARIESSSMTQAGSMLGTPAYMSPEQFMGQPVDPRSDIYSAGTLLYQLLTGERAFDGSVSAIMHKVLYTDPPAPSALSVTTPRTMDAVVARAMAKRPEQRFASAQEFAQAMHAAMEGRVAPPPPDDGDDTEATMVRAAPNPPLPAPEPVPAIAAAPVVSVDETLAPVAVPLAVAGPAAAPGAKGGGRGAMLLLGALVLLAALGGGGWFVLQPRPSAPVQTASEKAAPEPVPPAPAIVVATPAPAPAAPGDAKPSAIAVATPDPAPPPAAPPAPLAEAAPSVPAASVPVAPVPVAAADTPAQAAAPPPTPVPVPVPVAPVPGPQAAVVRPVSPASLSALRQALAGVGCTLTSTGLGDDGTVYVTGLGGHGTAEDGLRRAAAGAVPGVTIGWSVLPFDGPYCGVLDSLRPLRARQANALGLALRGNVIRLRQNDKIVLEVTMPDFAGLLQIDYLANDGTVQHLVADDGSQRHVMTSDGWKNAGPSHRYAAGEHVVIGQPDPKTGDGGWDVDAPFGVDMIVAVASSEVLFAKTRPATDATGEYLRALRAAFDRPAVRNGRLAGQAVLLETVAR